MSDKSFNDQAAVLIEDAVDLIKQVLVKHSAAVLEEMHDQIVARNDRISELEAAIAQANIKGHEAVLLAMKHEDVAKRANAEVFRLAELLRKADPKWGSPMHLNTSTKPPAYKYPETFCSQCGGEFGPGNEGFSHCENHKHLPRLG